MPTKTAEPKADKAPRKSRAKASPAGVPTMTLAVKDLRRGVEAAARVAATATFLNGVLLEAEGTTLRVTSTDLERTITMTVPLGAMVDQPLVAYIPAKLLADVGKNLPGPDVTIAIGADVVTLTSQAAQFDVVRLDAEKFPIARPELADGAVTMPMALFRSIASKVGVAASNDVARPSLTGVLLEAGADGFLRAVATDSYRLAMLEPGTPALAATILVPAVALLDLAKAAAGDDVQVSATAEQLVLVVGDMSLSVRLIEAAFPNYTQLIPTASPIEMTFPRLDLLDRLRRAALITAEGYPLRIVVDEDAKVTLRCSVPDTGSFFEEVDGATANTLSLTVGFNPKYLASLLDSFDDDEVTLQMTDPLKPTMVRSADGKQTCIIMPVRVS